MKKFFKFILKLILVIIILVVVLVAGVFIAITDNKYEEPEITYDTTATIDNTLSKTLSSSLDNLGTNYTMDLIFDEETLNDLLYAVALKLNPKYNPGKEDATADEKYIKSFEIPADIPVVGGKAMGLKGIYGEVNTETEEVTLNITADVDQKVKTRICFSFKVTTTDNEYVLEITKFKFAKINLMMGLVLKGLQKAEIEDIVNDILKDLPFTFAIKNEQYQLICTKADFNDYVKGLISKDGDSGMASEFIDLFLDPSRDMIKFGMFAKGFGVQIDLHDLQVSESATKVDESVKEGFDTNKFIETQAQALIINGIYSSGPKFLSISEADMTKLIYQNMLKDSEIKFETELMAGVNFKFALEGITFDIDDEAEHLLINIIMNINGLKTTAVLTGNIEQTQVVNEQVKINLKANKLKLGKDIEMDSAFLTDILSENFSNSDIMKFEDGALVFSADVFNTMLATAMSGKNADNLTVSGIGFVKDNLRIYVEYTNTELAAQIDKVTSSLKGALEEGITLDTSKFDEAELEKVAVVQEKLDEIKEKDISSITPEDTDALMAAVGEMSSEAQEEFLNSVTENVSEADLQALYDLMFANN